MTESPSTPNEPTPTAAARRDEQNWANDVATLTVASAPVGGLNLNVEGRRLAGPLQGFGQMWRKLYRVRLDGAVAPAEVIATWKEHFGEFWPKGNRFYGPLSALAPGDVAVLNLDIPGPVELSTGVFVLYADDVSFTFMTPQGHVMAAWITFSAATEGDTTIVQTEVLMRASDPIYEIGMLLFVQRKENAFWRHTLRNLAGHFGTEAEVEMEIERVDPRRQWRRAGNVWYNAGVRTVLYVGSTPLRAVARRVRRRGGGNVGTDTGTGKSTNASAPPTS